MGASSLRDRYAIVGIGQSKVGEIPGSTSLGLLSEAVKNATEDAGLTKEDIDGLVVRGPDDAYTHHQRLGQVLGLDVGFSTTLDNGGASQILSIATAIGAIEAGLCSVAVCGFGRNAWSLTHTSEDARMRSTINRAHRDSGVASNEFSGEEFGMFGPPAIHALGARRHMYLYGTTKEHFGAVAIAFRKHARRNPGAQMYHKELTMADYSEGRPIVDPFNLFDCSLRTDGAGAVVVTSLERARDLKRRPVLVSGIGSHNNARGWLYGDHMVDTAAQQSAQKAYAMAACGPADIDVFQVYDCFTYMVLAQLEDYGFCKKGDGGPFVASGALDLDGELPTNTSGGQLSEGHTEGMLQILEAARQVRHDYGQERQVEGAEVAMVSGHGGNTVCHSSLILRAG